LVLASHDGRALDAGPLNAVTAAKAIGGDVPLLVSGAPQAVAQAAQTITGVSKVLHADAPALAHNVAESNAALVADLVAKNKYTHVVAAADARGKSVIPRAASLTDVGALTDVISVVSEDTFTRPIYAGNAIATVNSTDTVKFLTVRQTAFPKADAKGGNAPLETVGSVPATPNAATWKSEELTKSERPPLQGANIIVSGGRGLKSGENFQLLYDLAKKLGAAVGASRAAVDAGFVPNDMQIGQTGKIVAPQLYIAVGLSGAIQHLAGMKDSKVIVCINKDPDAPIFQVSDYGLVADLFKAVPEMTSKV